MNYYVARNGQTYGPYSEETIRKYLARRLDDGQRSGPHGCDAELGTLGQIRGRSVAMPLAPASDEQAPPPASVAPASGGAEYPSIMHGRCILLIADLFERFSFTIWGFIQANWIKSIDPTAERCAIWLSGLLPDRRASWSWSRRCAPGAVSGFLKRTTHPVAVLGSMVERLCYLCHRLSCRIRLYI